MLIAVTSCLHCATTARCHLCCVQQTDTTASHQWCTLLELRNVLPPHNCPPPGTCWSADAAGVLVGNPHTTVYHINWWWCRAVFSVWMIADIYCRTAEWRTAADSSLCLSGTVWVSPLFSGLVTPASNTCGYCCCCSCCCAVYVGGIVHMVWGATTQYV